MQTDRQTLTRAGPGLVVKNRAVVSGLARALGGATSAGMAVLGTFPTRTHSLRPLVVVPLAGCTQR